MKRLLGALRACLYGRPFLVEEKRTRLLLRLKYLRFQDELSMSFAELERSLKDDISRG